VTPGTSSYPPTGGRARRAVVAVAAVLALLAVVGASARRPLDGGAAAPSLPVWPLLVVVGAGLVLGAALSVSTLGHLGGRRAFGGRKVRPGPLTLALSLLVPAAIVVAYVHPVRLDREVRPGPAQVATQAPRQPTPAKPGAGAGRDAAALAAGIAAGIVGLAAVGVVAARRRRRRPGLDARELVAAGTREAIDEIAIPADPRAAVLAAYARMERALTGAGLGRRPSEAPREYLLRFEAALGAGRRPAERLTALFERARFSPHAIDERLRGDALDALNELRADLEPR
jgi:hypothetical protein